jgi:hypothetical protein
VEYFKKEIHARANIHLEMTMNIHKKFDYKITPSDLFSMCTFLLKIHKHIHPFVLLYLFLCFMSNAKKNVFLEALRALQES